MIQIKISLVRDRFFYVVILACSLASAELLRAESALLEEVVIYGTRKSLESSLSVKRNSDQIVDSLSAEGIAKLPDLNLAEALGRIPGVQVSRGGVSREGGVTLRGLPGQFQRSTLNGRYLASAGRDGLAFGRMRSEVFSGIDVIKSQTAKNVTGGLSGLVDLKTGGALGLDDKTTISLDHYHESLTQTTKPGAAITFTRQLIEEKLAVRGALGVKKNDFRTDQMQIAIYDIDDGGTAEVPTDDLYTPRQLRFDIDNFDSETLAGSFGLEYKINENLHAKLDGFYNNDDSTDIQQQLRIESRGGSTRTALGEPVIGVFGGTQQHITIEKPRIWHDVRGRLEDHTVSAMTASLNWENDVWQIGGTVHQTEAERQRLAPGLMVRLEDKSPNNDFIANINIGNGDPSAAEFDLSPDDSAQLIDLDQDFGSPTSSGKRQIRSVLHGGNESIQSGFLDTLEKDEELSFQIDISRSLKMGPFTMVSAGLSRRDKEQSDDSARITLFGGKTENVSNAMHVPSSIVSEDDFLGGGLGKFDAVNDFGSVDLFGFWDALRPFEPNDSSYTLNAMGITTLVDSTAAAAIFENEVEIVGGYVQVDFSSEISELVTFHGNFGIRREETTRSTTTRSTDGVRTFEYSNTLPLINLVADIGESFVARLSYTETMRRPEADEYAVTRVIDVRADQISIDIGAANLRPFLAENLDFSFEWYNREGSAVTLGIFDREITDFASPDYLCPADGGSFGFGVLQLTGSQCLTTVATPAVEGGFPIEIGTIVEIEAATNQDSFTISGFEISIQQNLDFLPSPWNALGGQINYTSVDLDSSGGFELEEVSEDSYNIILYYETERLGARAAFNSRSDYLMPGGGSFRGAERRGDDRTQLDLAFRYAVNDNMNLSLEIFNLTDEILYEYEADKNRPRNYFSYGRTISFGLRYEM